MLDVVVVGCWGMTVVVSVGLVVNSVCCGGVCRVVLVTVCWFVYAVSFDAEAHHGGGAWCLPVAVKWML